MREGILRLVVLGLFLVQAGLVDAAWPREEAERFSAGCVASVIDAGASEPLHAEVASACACAIEGFAAHLSSDAYAAFEQLDPPAKAAHPAAAVLGKVVLACADRLGELADRTGGPLPHDLLEATLKACVMRAGTVDDANGRIGAAGTLQLSRTCQCTTDGVRNALSPRMLFRTRVVPTGYLRFVRETIATIETTCRDVILGMPSR